MEAGRFPQFPQGGYVTPGSSRSNSSSSLYPGPVYGTAIVPSPLVPSLPRSKTPDSRPSTGQSNAHPWQAGVSTSASGSSTCTSPVFSPRLLALAHLPCSRICRRSRAIAHEVTSPRTQVPHAPCVIVHTSAPCPHLLRYSLHPIRADSRGSDDTCTRAGGDARAARNGATDPSELSARPAFAQAAMDRRRRADRFTTELLRR